jgi:uncharacterized protein (AIM24 family)
MNSRTSHNIDYQIFGEELQFVEIELDPAETAVAESGAFMMMGDGIHMQTIFGDGSARQPTGLLGKLFSAGKRLLVGESLFMTAFTNESQQKRKVSFAAPYTGKIIPFDLKQLGGTIIAQKDAFLCARQKHQRSPFSVVIYNVVLCPTVECCLCFGTRQALLQGWLLCVGYVCLANVPDLVRWL